MDVEPSSHSRPARRVGPAELGPKVTSGRSWRVTLFATLLLGGLTAVAVGLGTAPEARTFTAVSGPVQSSMSVLVAFLGVLTVREHSREKQLVRSLVSAAAAAGAVAFVGAAMCALVVAFGPPTEGRWQHAALIMFGSVLVQALALLTGTGLGLLLRSTVLACAATIVLPLGIWFLLGQIRVLAPLQAWITPYSSVPLLLAGQMTPIDWVHWLTTASLWGVALNLAGGWWAMSRSR